jgi:hypothetical protein
VRDKICRDCGLHAHPPDCPQMSFPSGRRRDDPAPGAVLLPALKPLNPPPPGERAEIAHPGGWSPISEQMSKIFAGLAEAKIERHIAEQRRLQAEALL